MVKGVSQSNSPTPPPALVSCRRIACGRSPVEKDAMQSGRLRDPSPQDLERMAPRASRISLCPGRKTRTVSRSPVDRAQWCSRARTAARAGNPAPVRLIGASRPDGWPLGLRISSASASWQGPGRGQIERGRHLAANRAQGRAGTRFAQQHEGRVPACFAFREIRSKITTRPRRPERDRACRTPEKQPVGDFTSIRVVAENNSAQAAPCSNPVYQPFVQPCSMGGGARGAFGRRPLESQAAGLQQQDLPLVPDSRLLQQSKGNLLFCAGSRGAAAARFHRSELPENIRKDFINRQARRR